MGHLERIPKKVSIPIKPDEEGYVGRECPQNDCLGYFKITPGTGVKGEGDPYCYCPYCGHSGEHNKFFTREQIEYAKSVVFHQITDAFLKDMKRLEFDHKPRGAFGIGISMKVQGRPQPVRYYRERALETQIVCNRCTLRYAIYGVFAYCPDCGTHNSQQILEKNLELAEKEVILATGGGHPEMSDYLVADALENIVSAFDGFGREICRVNAALASGQGKAENISFQNLFRARDRVRELFGFDLSAGIVNSEWEFANRCFQKRHLLAHKMGIIDEAYVQSTKDPLAAVGRKVRIENGEPADLAGVIRKLGSYLAVQLEGLQGKSPNRGPVGP